MSTNDSGVHFAGGTLGRQRHICAFFNSTEEEHRILRSFFKDGFDQGQKAFHVVDPELREDHLRRLAGAGINVQQGLDTGQLEVLPWKDAYLREERFDQDAMLALIEEAVKASAKFGDPVICSYQVSRFSASVLMDIMRTHPAVIIGGVLQENPFFVPPDQFLVEIRERRSLGDTARLPS